MNNSHFRNLITDTKAKPSTASSNAATFKHPLLGSRVRSSIPMTPRSLLGHNPSKDFGRQVAEKQAELDGQPPAKKLKSSAAPKGTKLPQGYQDRSSSRRTEGEDENVENDKLKRLQALEEMLKLQQIDQQTFERLRDEIGVGGDVNSTHLVKGLDWKLLARIRRGEDLNSNPKLEDDLEKKNNVDLDDELEAALQKDVTTLHDSMNPNVEPQIPEQNPTMSRDEILRQLKTSRTLKQTPSEPLLSEKFIKVAKKPSKERSIEEVDGKRREVMVVTNPDGTTKRKTRWLDPEKKIKPASRSAEDVPQVMGMEVPAEFAAKQKALAEQEEDDGDIFAGVGADYNPLGDMSSDDEASDREDRIEEPEQQVEESARSRNYFSTNDHHSEAEDKRNPIAKDPMLMAALKRAAALRRDEQEMGLTGHGGDTETDVDPVDRQKLLLEKLKRRDQDDSRDLDMGFGESRFGDEDDEDGPVWNDDGDEEKKKPGRKRGAKKRKGDKNSAADVMSVLEARNKSKP